jgi:hypothetical protein
MLDLRFKSFHLISSFVGWDESVSIVDEYDKRSLYPMLLMCYHHLHPIIKFVGCVDQTIDEDYSLGIFQQITFTFEPTKEFITKELLISNVTKWIPKTSSVFFSGGKNMKPCFL